MNKLTILLFLSVLFCGVSCQNNQEEIPKAPPVVENPAVVAPPVVPADPPVAPVDPPVEPIVPVEPPVVEQLPPVDGEGDVIPFTEYLLNETGCWLENPNYVNEVVIVNSKSDLEKYITCMEGSSTPDVDFSTQTVLLARGVAPAGIDTLSKKLFCITEDNKYVLEIKIILNDAAIAGESWTAILVTNKLIAKDNKIELNIIIDNTTVQRNFPIGSVDLNRNHSWDILV